MTEITKPQTPKPETVEDLTPAQDPKGGNVFTQALSSILKSQSETQKGIVGNLR